ARENVRSTRSSHTKRCTHLAWPKRTSVAPIRRPRNVARIRLGRYAGGIFSDVCLVRRTSIHETSVPVAWNHVRRSSGRCGVPLLTFLSKGIGTDRECRRGPARSNFTAHRASRRPE